MRKLLKLWLGLMLASCGVSAVHAACTYSLAPGDRSHGNGATTNGFTVNAGLGCTWGVTNTNSWITILSGESGTSTGTVTYAVSANLIPTGRTGLIFVADAVFTLEQDPAPCNFTITPASTTRGAGGVAFATFSVGTSTNCSWSIINTSAWVTLPGATSGTGTNASVGYSVAANNIPIQRSNVMSIGNKTFTIYQNAASCIYEFTPVTNRLHGHGATNNSVTVDVIGANCAWYVVNTNSWITISNVAGTNDGVVGYSIAANPGSTQRVGTFSVWDQAFFTIYQQGAPCTYSLSPSSVSPSAEAETNSITITTPTGCAWSVTNTNSWISFEGPTSGVSSGTLTWVVAANAGSIGRTGVVSVSGQSFTVRQAAAVCNYKLSPTNRVHGYGAASNSVNLTVLSVCPWTVVNTNPWVTIHTPTNGVGSAAVGYSITANGNVGPRTGAVVIGGQPFTLTQNGLGCAVDLTPAMRPHGHGMATNTIIVDVAAGCEWNLVNTNSWITIVGATNGTGSNTVTYTIEANPSTFGRDGYVVVNEDNVHITQSGAPCNPSFVPSSLTHSAAQETGTVSVVLPIGCVWTVDNTNSWITLLSETNAIGSTNISYLVATNLNPLSRTGYLAMAGEAYPVIQSGVICNYRLSPTNRTHGAGPNTNTLSLIVSNPCPWFVVNTNPWITILSGASGAGTGVITYAFSANTAPAQRVGVIEVDGAQTFITQNGVSCTYSIIPARRTHGYGAASNSFGINTGAGCAWDAFTTNDWIALTGPSNGIGNGLISYSITENTNLVERIGHIAADGLTFVITQRAATCAIDLTPGQRAHGHGANTSSISIATAPGCTWSVDNTNAWVTIVPGYSGLGNDTVTYTISSNTDVAPRSGNIVIGDAVFAISQSAFVCTYRLSPTNRQHGFGATTGSVNVIASPGCAWSVATTSEWITLTSPTTGVGNSNFTYSIAANFENNTRVGYITMLDQVLTISQLAPTNGFQFELTTLNPGGDLTVRLGGGPAGIWELQSSSNLLDWVKITDLTNITGRVEYTIPPPLADKKFLRAVLP
jgi:hypothetical protein